MAVRPVLYDRSVGTVSLMNHPMVVIAGDEDRFLQRQSITHSIEQSQICPLIVLPRFVPNSYVCYRVSRNIYIADEKDYDLEI
jgi:hypothetical protein